jgi:hypothetical protein
MGTTALLLPLTAVTESQIRTGGPSTSLSATAQLNFKIIIPKVLYLQVGREGDRVEGSATVAIMSNSHNVALNASLRTALADGFSRGNLILSAGAGKAIAQEALCALDEQRAVPVAASSESALTGHHAVTTGRLLCTASMP